MKVFSEESALQLSEMLLQNDKDIKTEIEGKIPSVEGLASEKYVDDKVKNVEVNLDGYATETFVNNAIANAQLGGGDTEIDLSGYATKDDLKGYAAKEHTHDEYLTEHQDLSDYALKSEIPTDYLSSIPDEYVTTEEMAEAINNAKLDGESVDLSDYAKKTDIPDTSNFVEKEDGKGLFSGSYDDLTDKPTVTNGKDGFSPTATVTKEGRVSTLTVTDKNGTTSVQIHDGKDENGDENKNNINSYIKPLTDSWFIAEQSPYVLDARNDLETYWNDEIARRCFGASDYLYSKFDELENNGYCVKKQLTTVTHNGIVYPMNAYEFTYANDWIGGQDSYHVNNVSVLSQRLYNKPKILITSGVHGNERFTPVAVYEFMKKVCTDKDYVDIRTGFDFYVIPILNPTGIDADVRRNYQNIDINRDTVSKQTEEMKALIAYVDEVTNEKQSKFLYAMDFHQAPTNDDVMSAFMSLPTNVVDEFVYGRFVNNGQKALKSIREYLELKDTTSQRVYAWKGQEGDTIRNLMSDYSECSTCWECSHYEQVYTKSNIRNNPTASLIHNSLLDITCRCLFDSSLIGTKYLGTETASKNTLTSITATKGKTNYQINDVLNVDDLTVTANYSDGTSNVVTNYTTNASGIDMTTAGVKALIITYTDGVVKTTTVTINVSEASSDNGLEVYNKFNGYLSVSGNITTSSEAKQIHVYQVEPSKTYKVTAHITTYDKNIIHAQYPTFVNTNNTALSNSNSKYPSSGDTSANVTIAEGNNFLYLYNSYACDIASGLGFTVEEV